MPLGGAAGFLGGLLGVGGGNIILPGLVSIGVTPKQASAAAAASVAGAVLGSWPMSRKLANRQVKRIIAVLLYLIAAKMLFDLWG